MNQKVVGTTPHQAFALLIAVCGFLFLSTASAHAATTATLLPTNDGTYTQWTPKSGATHYTMVDESSCNGTTDYVSTTVTGNRDSFGVSLSSIPDGSTITQIAITPCASRASNGGGAGVLNVFYRYNGTNSADAGAYAITGTTPTALATTNFSSLSLAKNSSSALQIGGVFTSGNKGARLGRIATVITYTAPTVPNAPTDLSVYVSTSTPTDVFVYWTDNATDEDGFAVERSTDNVNFTTIATMTSNTTYIMDEGLASGGYYYRVYAQNIAGNSTYSDVAFAFIP